MGAGARTHEELAAPLGRRLAGLGVHLLTGGGSGVMTSVSRAFAGVRDRAGLVIGVLPLAGEDCAPGAPGEYPNPWVEVPIRTHLGRLGADPFSRNHVNVLTSDVVVALPGSSGTASEVALAVEYGRPLVLFGDPGRARGLPGAVATATSVDEVIAFVRRTLARGGTTPAARIMDRGHAREPVDSHPGVRHDTPGRGSKGGARPEARRRRR